MKRIFFTLTTILLCLQQGYSQHQIWTENFDGTVTFSKNPSSFWTPNTSYFISAPNSYYGEIPNAPGDSTILESILPYDFENYSNIQIEFYHICKVDTSDIVRIEYSTEINAGVFSPWTPVPVNAYYGHSESYSWFGFNAMSYPEWNVANILEYPDQSWWKKEVFVLSDLVAGYKTKFRFVIKRGNKQGSQVSYGWLIDDFVVRASTDEMVPPHLVFVSPFLKDTVYTTGIHAVTAEVKSNTSAALQSVTLEYIATKDGISTTETIPMINTGGDIWSVNMPQLIYGTAVSYSITVTDVLNNVNNISSNYYIQTPPPGRTGYSFIGNPNSSGTTNSIPFYNRYSWSRTIVKGSEINGGSGGFITSVSFLPSQKCNDVYHQSMYFKIVSDTSLNYSTERTYRDPVNDTALLVWDGDLPALTAGQWIEITLDKPFMLPPNANLLIYWDNKGGSAYEPAWYATYYSYYMATSYTDYSSFPSGGSGNVSNYRPNMQLFTLGASTDSNSVALIEFTSPDPTKIQQGQSVSIDAIVKNKGIKSVTSLTLKYSVNGVVYTSPAWNGHIPQDFKDTLHFGTYTPSPNKYDTVFAWVELPNGEEDPAKEDDTLSILTYACSINGFAGEYTIGNGEVFTTVNQFYQYMKYCGVSDNITLKLKDGTYPGGINLIGLNAIMNNHLLTIIPESGNKDNVIIQPAATGVCIELSNSDNVRIETLTVNLGYSMYGIQFTGPCTNVVINNCNILSSNTSSGRHIQKFGSAGGMSNIRITNNYMEKGECGIYFEGWGSTSPDIDIVIDNNTILKPYRWGLNLHYLDAISISNNYIQSPGMDYYENTYSEWYGFNLQNSNAQKINGNRIIHRYDEINNQWGVTSNPYGMYLKNVNIRNNVQPAIISNNEIKTYSTAQTTPGMYIAGVIANIINNSIYAERNNNLTNQYGSALYIYDDPNSILKIKNNLLVGNGKGSGYYFMPIWLSGVTNLSKWEFDYNNMKCLDYAYVAYASGAATAWNQLADWKVTTSDRYSTNITPSFITTAWDSLVLSDYTGLDCPVFSGINEDINGKFRAGMTTMGCYAGTDVPTVGAYLSEILNFSELPVTGQTDDIKIVFVNGGQTLLDTATFQWQLSGMPVVEMPWKGALATGKSDTVSFNPPVSYIQGTNSLKVWIKDLGDILVDNYKQDDTLSVESYGCDSVLNGVYTVGTGKNFGSLGAAIKALTSCGINGPVTLHILEDDYNEGDLVIEKIDGSSDINTITFTSDPANANIPTISSSNIAFTIKEGRDIILRDLTFDASNGMIALKFEGTCQNIEVNNCTINAKMTTSTGYYGISYTNTINSGKKLDNIRILNNTITGGYANIYFHYPGSSATTMGEMIINNNILDSASVYGLYSNNHGYYPSISDNIIRTKHVGSTQYGMYLYYQNSVDTMRNNKIYLNGGTTTSHSLYGIHLTRLNDNTSLAKHIPQIVNNEIIKSAGTGVVYGIRLSLSRADVFHNSVYLKGDKCYGLWLEDLLSGLTPLVIKNNLLYTSAATEGYPIYVKTAVDATTGKETYLDYNSYSNNGTNIGYIGSAKEILEDLQLATGQDGNSVDKLPVFSNPGINTELSDYKPFLCPSVGINDDINGNMRISLTSMGAHTYSFPNLDVLAWKVNNWKEEIIYGEDIDLNINIVNGGITPISEIDFGWSVNGDEYTFTWQPSSPLQSGISENVAISTFSVATHDSVKVIVWIKNVNGNKDNDQSNDTVSALANVIPLAWLEKPLVKDTINSLSFNVYMKVMGETGAPVSNPEICLTNTINGVTTLYDTIPMILQNGLWTANVSGLYYGSEVLYSITVADANDIDITLTDTVFVKFSPASEDEIIIEGTPSTTTNYAPYANNYQYGWSRSLYLNSEIDPSGTNIAPITEIAWYTTSSPQTKLNQEIYLQAVPDISVPNATWIDPATNGATLVWSGSITTISGWNNIVLDVPFVLPQGMNLMIYWINNHGAYTSAVSWKATNTSPVYMAAANWSTSSFPTNVGAQIYQRPDIKCMFKYDPEKYKRYNLSMLDIIIESENLGADMCAPDYASVDLIIANTGEIDYDFSVNSVVLTLEQIAPIPFSADLPVNTGTLLSGEQRKINITNLFPIMAAGKYEIKAWLSSPRDNVLHDNTLIKSTYPSQRSGLPIDENFSGTMPLFFNSTGNTNDKWGVVQGSSIDQQINPVFGTGMLSFTGKRSATSSLTTGQLSMYGTVNPTLELWYAHTTDFTTDYTEVYITLDDWVTEDLLFSIKKYDPSLNGWKKYSADLSSYTTGSCVKIRFSSMVKYQDGGEQNIDRIRIISDQDISVSQMLLTPVSLCNLTGKELKFVVENTTGQDIDFEANPTSLQIDVFSGKSPTVSYNHPFDNGSLKGFAYDTITVPFLLDFAKDTFIIVGHITTSIDKKSGNDTLRDTIIVNPEISVKIHQLSAGNSSCLLAESSYQQEITITNTGNVDLSGIELLLNIDTGSIISSLYYTLKETLPGTLIAGQSIRHPFSRNYIAPWNADYQLRVVAYLGCDSVIANSEDLISECVDMKDLSVIDIDNPSGNKDKTGDLVSISAVLKNRSDVDDFSGIKISARIEDSQGVKLDEYTESGHSVGALSTVPYAFTKQYMVPNDSVYYVTVFLSSGTADPLDNYSHNDTLRIKRMTDNDDDIESMESMSILMNQNIPNPANNSTTVRYSIPQSGEVVFRIHSMSGQILYNKVIESGSGDQSIEINTSRLSSGIYMYSMEYKGQRIVKRMSVN